jgi:hypothetical protein
MQAAVTVTVANRRHPLADTPSPWQVKCRRRCFVASTQAATGATQRLLHVRRMTMCTQGSVPLLCLEAHNPAL